MLKGLFLEWVPWIFNQTSLAVGFTHRVVLAAYTEATVEKEWLILHSIPIPVLSTHFPDVPQEQIRWRVKMNPIEFTDSSGITELHHISYLSLSICSDTTILDLTEWINEVQWCGRVQPTPLELFTIWCCEMGKSYFHLLSIAEVEIITELGDTIRQRLV